MTDEQRTRELAHQLWQGRGSPLGAPGYDWRRAGTALSRLPALGQPFVRWNSYGIGGIRVMPKHAGRDFYVGAFAQHPIHVARCVWLLTALGYHSTAVWVRGLAAELS